MAKAPSKSAIATRTPNLRLLPILIFVAGLMLSFRVGDIWKGLSGLESVRVASELEAQQPARGRGGAQPPAPEAAPQPAVQQSGPGPAATPVALPAPDDTRSPTEMDVLQKLSERRAQIELREKDVVSREALLKAAEDKIDHKIAELKSLQSTIEGLLRQYNDQEDNKMRSLVKIYENMKPKEAAKIFEQLDMAILLEVVERMKEQRVAPILAEMDPSKARTVTSELAQRRQIPLPKPSTGG